MTDSYNNIKFKETRALRTGKEKCKAKYFTILAEGPYTAEEILAALKYEVDLKKKQSLQGHENKLSFMNNSITYLNQRVFESFIDLAKETKPFTNTTDTVFL